MPTGSQQRTARRWVLVFVAALVAVLATVFSAATASAATTGAAETRVRASNFVADVLIEPPEHKTAGQPLGNNAAGPGIVVATGVAAKTGDGLLSPGPHAGRSIPGDSTRNFTRQQRNDLNDIMGETGCHRCGTTNPGTKSGDAIPDHQPPLSQSEGPFQLYPHCLACSREQGLFIANLIRRGGAQ